MVRQIIPTFSPLLIWFAQRDRPHCNFTFYWFCQVYEVFNHGIFSLNRNNNVGTEWYEFSTKVTYELTVTPPYFFTICSKSTFLIKTQWSHAFGYGLHWKHIQRFYLCKVNPKYMWILRHCCASILSLRIYVVLGVTKERSLEEAKIETLWQCCEMCSFKNDVLFEQKSVWGLVMQACFEKWDLKAYTKLDIIILTLLFDV